LGNCGENKVSKGSKQRPKQISNAQFDANWEKIFGTKEPKKEPKMCGNCWLETGNPKCKCGDTKWN